MLESVTQVHGVCLLSCRLAAASLSSKLFPQSLLNSLCGHAATCSLRMGPRNYIASGTQTQGLALYCSIAKYVTPPTGAGTVQHPEPGGVSLAMLCAAGPGAPDHPVLCRQDPQGGAAVQHGGEVVQVQLRPACIRGGKTATTDCCSLGNQSDRPHSRGLEPASPGSRRMAEREASFWNISFC